MKLKLLLAGLVLFGGWQLGQGAYLLAKAELAQWLLQQAWQEMQTAAKVSATSNQAAQKVPPWPWADTWPLAKLYWDSHDQELIVLAGGTGRNLAFGPAHISASALPGEQGVSVIGGHRDTHFAFLQNVAIDDEFALERINGELLRFQVKEILITDVRESRIALDSPVAKIALVSCYPFTDWEAGSPLRYLVIAELISSKVEQVPPTTSKMLTTMSL